MVVIGYHSNKNVSTGAEREAGRMRVDGRWLCLQSPVSVCSCSQLQSSVAQVALRPLETPLALCWQS